MGTAIRIDRLHQRYRSQGRDVIAIDDVSLDIRQNEFFTLLGPSGCGKTTTLRSIAGLEQPTSGTIELDGVVVVSDRTDVPTYKRDLGMVFQDYAIWPHMSVFENIAFPLRYGRRRYRRAEIQRRVEEALDLVNMSEYIGRRATQLSGGQQQRLSLARALVRQPKVLLLDEPLSNLDAKLREQMRGELRLIQERIGVTTVFVTHDQVEALSLSTRIAVMNRGRVVQIGTPREIYLEPADGFVADFVGDTSFVPGTVTAVAPDATHVDTPLGPIVGAPSPRVAVGDAVEIALRTEALVVSETATDAENAIRGTVQLALFVGDGVDYRIDAGGIPIRARGSARTQIGSRTDVVVSLSAGDAIVLPKSTEAGTR